MGRTWQLQEAKSKLSEVVEEALEHGPQVITRRGVETVVVISVTDYQRLKRPKINLVDFFRNSPLVGLDLDLERDKSPLRPDVDL